MGGGINWVAVGVVSTLLVAIVGGAFTLGRLIFSSRNDTAVPAATIEEQVATAVKAAMATAQLEDRVNDLERDLRTTRDELQATRVDLQTARAELRDSTNRERALKLKVDDQQQQITTLRRQLGERTH